MHEHNECEHKFKYCEKCDVVYCTKCEREWGGHKHNWWYVYPYTTTVFDGLSGSATRDYTITVGDTNPNHSHT